MWAAELRGDDDGVVECHAKVDMRGAPSGGIVPIEVAVAPAAYFGSVKKFLASPFTRCDPIGEQHDDLLHNVLTTRRKGYLLADGGTAASITIFTEAVDREIPLMLASWIANDIIMPAMCILHTSSSDRRPQNLLGLNREYSRSHIRSQGSLQLK